MEHAKVLQGALDGNINGVTWDKPHTMYYLIINLGKISEKSLEDLRAALEHYRCTKFSEDGLNEVWLVLEEWKRLGGKILTIRL